MTIYFLHFAHDQLVTLSDSERSTIHATMTAIKSPSLPIWTAMEVGQAYTIRTHFSGASMTLFVEEQLGDDLDGKPFAVLLSSKTTSD